MGWGTVGRAGLEVCWLWVQAGAQGECCGPTHLFPRIQQSSVRVRRPERHTFTPCTPRCLLLKTVENRPDAVGDEGDERSKEEAERTEDEGHTQERAERH